VEDGCGEDVGCYRAMEPQSCLKLEDKDNGTREVKEVRKWRIKMNYTCV
jgi:hypothetical protein